MQISLSRGSVGVSGLLVVVFGDICGVWFARGPLSTGLSIPCSSLMIGLSGHPPLIFLGRGEAVNGAEGGAGSGAGCGVVAVSGRSVELRQAAGLGRRGSS